MTLLLLKVCLAVYVLRDSSTRATTQQVPLEPVKGPPEVRISRPIDGVQKDTHGPVGESFGKSLRAANNDDGTIDLSDPEQQTTTGTPSHDCRSPESRCGAVKKLDEIYADLHQIVEKHSNLAKLSVIGKTFKGNPIYVVEIHSGYAFYYSIIIVDFGMHPREWASPASALHVMTKLIEEGGAMTENIQWFFIPMGNPDGYAYSTTVNNMWRKNRSPNKGTNCSGVDLNRNFGVGWETSLSVDPCREDFSGSEPFSEIESKVLRNFVKDIDPQLVDAYVSVHACLQSVFHPYEYTEEEPPADILKNLKEVGFKMAKAMYQVRNESYYVGTNSEHFAGGGDTGDFMFGSFHIPLVFRMELGDFTYFEDEDYHECYHPSKPAVKDGLKEECLAGLRALASHLIETRAPYRNKVKRESAPGNRSFPIVSLSATYSDSRVISGLLLTLVALLRRLVA